MRIAFMGTPDFAVPALRALVDAGHEVVCVYTQPPRPAGRGKKYVDSPVAKVAQSLGLSVQTPDRFRNPDCLQAFKALNLDVAVVVAYGQILPQEALDAPKFGCLNIHASLLPRWRGAAPIHRAVMAGDKETGVAIMQMEAGLDTGPVLSEERILIDPTDTTGDLHDKLKILGAELIVETLANVEKGKIQAQVQPDGGVTYAKKIDKSESRIDWHRSALEICQHIHGLSPFPGAWTLFGDERLKIHRAMVAPDKYSGKVGDIKTDGGLKIICGDGAAVELQTVQRAGKAPMSTADFLRGFDLTVVSTLV